MQASASGGITAQLASVLYGAVEQQTDLAINTAKAAAAQQQAQQQIDQAQTVLAAAMGGLGTRIDLWV